MKWKDDIKNILFFIVFFFGNEILMNIECYFYLRKFFLLESYVMYYCKGEIYKVIVVCMVN